MTGSPSPQKPARKVRDYRDLIVWRHAITLAGECHRLAASFHGRDGAGLAGQLRRAATSVSANIAEGNGRLTRTEYLRFLGIAHGSLRELESHLAIAVELGIVTEGDTAAALATARQTGQLLVALIKRLRVSDPRRKPTR